MFKYRGLIIIGVIVLGLVGAWLIDRRSPPPENNETDIAIKQPDNMSETIQARTDFSQFNEVFRFSAELPLNWQAKYIRETEAVALFTSSTDLDNLNSAQIFIRYFKASDFQTLSTVSILNREKIKVGTHDAISYEIEKKSNVANFANQPIWRNQKHRLTDIRLAPSGSTTFFVIAYNPILGQDKFNQFISTLIFYNDKASVRSPLDRVAERVSKKMFGTKVTPNDSPIQPERFSGYHTGWDFEIFPNELDQEVAVTTFCGGKLKVKETAGGYGGLVVQECNLDSSAMTVIYGHLKLASITAKVGEYLAPGTQLGLLGDDKSLETDGERKHLHFGLHKDSTINIRGYVDSQTELASWLNPKDFL